MPTKTCGTLHQYLGSPRKSDWAEVNQLNLYADNHSIDKPYSIKVAASQVFSKAAKLRPSALTPFLAVVLHRRRDVRGAFVPGKLQAYLDAQYAPLSDVIQACIVRHSDQLVRRALLPDPSNRA